MAPDTASPRPEAVEPPLRWSGRVSLTTRILAVNVFALALLAGGFFYLESYRARLIDFRIARAVRELSLMDEAIAVAPPADVPALLARMGERTGSRLRLYGPDGELQADSWRISGPNYVLRDPAEESWQRHAARFLDRVIDFVARAATPRDYVEPNPDRAAAWPELRRALQTGSAIGGESFAPDRTFMITAAAPAPAGGLLLTTNARDVTRIVRAERFRLGVLLLVVSALSIALSFFLARTIVRPLRRLARAAVRVRLGRDREVTVPRLPSRRDEIGSLAQALSDMTQALRQRIDATDAFAADVTHELKNPLASLRSAADALQRVSDDGQRVQLMAIIQDDVRRIDRLITDIAEASRLDAELSRARFHAIDLGRVIETMLREREMRGPNPRGVQVAFARPRVDTAVARGDEFRLARIVENLLDNAISFSPDNGLVQITATRSGSEVIVRVEDQGPGVPPELRESIFRRFTSVRSDENPSHSGLGLAIARAISDGHGGTLEVETQEERPHGAAFILRLPAVGAP
ncbi:putative two-component histidine kinase [Sphingomonas changbaiensis NBRC 104936]|uniref:histidine kinase n=1 Tax=Sphingomonas changbaiensis NBRC 104936 TaxID=1219043 RepID=A0A0E9MMU9_9SPHN|nr:stimulus-sensing domain-containing protein [Sphingomonas changbaiensis]GAO38440.1 putative two-component histidine kinase [Sphingomonas changbaiensis NBRC 104936]